MHNHGQSTRRRASKKAFPRGAWEQGNQAYTLIETTVALAILAAGFVLTAQILSVCARQRQSAGQLLVAQLEAANVLERIAAMPFDGVTSSAFNELSLSKETQAALVDGQLTATVEDAEDAEPRHKRIQVEVAWPIGEGPMRKVALTAWKYDLPEPEQRTINDK